jgi:hypothetical protein
MNSKICLHCGQSIEESKHVLISTTYEETEERKKFEISDECVLYAYPQAKKHDQFILCRSCYTDFMLSFLMRGFKVGF